MFNLAIYDDDSYILKLSSLPNISKWNTKNVKDMSGLFGSCIKY